MDLLRHLRTNVVHAPGCTRPQLSGELVHWGYGDDIGDLSILSGQTMIFSWLHCCRSCLPGVCKCRKCEGRKN